MPFRPDPFLSLVLEPKNTITNVTKKILHSSLSLLLLSSCFVRAEEGTEMLETLIVTASRLDSSADELTPSIEIITRDEINSRNTSSVTELLRQVAGSNIIQQGGRGGITSILLRGGEPNFTVVLIDGVKVNDPTNTRGGSYDFSNLDLAGIERIEVVRGPMSAVYGSDALAGVINIITGHDASLAEFAFEVGSYGYASANASVGGQRGKVAAGFELHALRDDGDVEGASYEGWGTTGRLTNRFSDRTQVGLRLRYQRSESTSFPEDSGGPRVAVIREVDEKAIEESHLRVFLEHEFAAGWEFDIAAIHYQRLETSTSPGIVPGVFNGVPPNFADTEFSRNQVVTSVRMKGADGFSFLAGAEWQREDGESSGVLDIGFPLSSSFELKRDTLSAFSEIGTSRGPLVLQGGLRWDKPDEIASETTARVGALYKLTDQRTEIRANWGQGFKAPSFFALAHPLVGNPALTSERATSIDFNLTRRFGDSGGKMGIGIFRNEFEDLVDFDPELFKNLNRSKVFTRGAEFTIELPLKSNLNLRGHLTYTDTEIVDSDAQLRGRPKWRGGTVVDWKMNAKWNLVTSVLILDKFYESSIPTGGLFLDGYTRFDAALTYRPRENLVVRFAVENLLDENYQEAVGFPATGIRGRIGIKYSL